MTEFNFNVAEHQGHAQSHISRLYSLVNGLITWANLQDQTDKRPVNTQSACRCYYFYTRAICCTTSKTCWNDNNIHSMSTQ